MDDTEPGSLAGSGAAPQPAPGASRWPESAAHWLEALPQGSVKIGRFTVLERLAAGGMGVVYAAYDSELDRKVAIKLLHEERASGTVRTRIVREARAMAKLSHPHVAQVFEVGEYLGSTFIAMEFVQGVTLRQWQQQEGRSWREVLAVYLQAGRGLAAAHAEGLVHRDFKPDNAMLGRDGRVRVLDFGLVRAEEREASVGDGEGFDAALNGAELEAPLTKPGSLLGTPAYMAPEQLHGEVADPRTDQFALCVSLWEGLNGERPFAGKTWPELVANVVTGRIRGGWRGDVPAWVRAVLERGLAGEPSKRFASMSALLAALEADPSRRRRRVLTAGAGVIVVLAGLAGYSIDRARRVRACREEAASLTHTWGDAARARVRTGLLGTEASFAQSTWERVEPRLDEYAAAWSEARESTCLAAEVEGTRSEELATRTTECLNEHRDRLAITVDTLASADVTVVRRAVSWIAELPRIAECTDDAWLGRRLQPPAEPELRASVTALRKELAEIEGSGFAGRWKDALPRARDASARAESIGWAPLHAEALLVLGRAESAVGELVSAERLLEQSFELALREAHDETAFAAAIALSLTSGFHRGRHERGLWWGLLASALAARLGDVDDVRTATAFASLSRIHEEAGAHAEAKAFTERALAIQERTLGSEHPAVAMSLAGLAVLHVRNGEYPQAQALYEQSLSITEQALGPDHPNVAGTLDGLAAASAELGAYDVAAAHLERALALKQAALGPDHPYTAQTLNNLGQVRFRTGAYAEAKTLCERVLAIRETSQGPDHPDVVDALGNLANVHAAMGDHPRAKALYERALAIAEKSLGPHHPDLVLTLIDFGNARFDAGRHTEAISLLERALALDEEEHGPEHPRVAMERRYLALARFETRSSRGESLAEAYTEAKAELDRVLAIEERAWGPEHPELVRAFLGLATIHVEAGAYTEAEASGARALSLAEHELGPHHPLVAEACFHLGRAHQGTGAHGEARAMLERALAIQERTVEPHHPLRVASLVHLAEIALAEGRAAEAVTLAERAVAACEAGEPTPEALASARLTLAEALVAAAE